MGKSLAEYKKLLDQAKSKEQKIIGQQEMLFKQLKEAGFETVDEALEELEKLGQEIDSMSADLKERKSEFEKTYGELLNG